MGDGQLHWVVRLNWRNRSLSFALMFLVLCTYLAGIGAGPAMWILLALQLLVYPHLVYWRARRADNPLLAEMHNMLADAALFGAWVAAWGFPLWIGFTLFISVTLNLMIFQGMRGVSRALLAVGIGALLAGLAFGLRFQPETPLSTSLGCIVALSLYLLAFSYGGYTRGIQLRENRKELHERLEEITALQAKLQEQAERDPLTGLPNRRHFDEEFDRALAECGRHGEVLALMMIDIDHFKRINDSYGHPAGDEMLKAVAGILDGHARAGGLACRYGGEEFLLALPGATQAGALRLAGRLREEFAAAPIEYDGYAMRATLSFGIAGFPGDGASAVELLKAADTALYAAKQGGRNRAVLFAQAA